MSSTEASDRKVAFQTLPQLWRQVCQRLGPRTALRHKRRGIWAGVSWQAFFEESRAIGLALSTTGIQEGEVISILSGNRPEWLFADFASQAMRYVSHGIYPTDSCAQVGTALKTAGTRIVFVEDVGQLSKVLEVRELCPRLLLIVLLEPRGLAGFIDPQVVMYADLLETGRSLAVDSAGQFDASISNGVGSQVACLAPTAATTGPARLAALTQSNLCSVARSIGGWLNDEPDNRSLSIVSLANAGERALSAVAPLVTQLLVHFPESAGTVVNDLREVEPQIVFAPSRFWEHLQGQIGTLMDSAISPAFGAYRGALEVDAPAWKRWLVLRNVRKRLGLRRVRMALAGGATVPAKLLRWLGSTGVPMFEAYVVAEASGFCSVTPASESLAGAGMRKLENVQMRLGANREILIDGPIVHLGYWHEDGAIRSSRKTSALETGDAGIEVEGGRVQFAGRLADRLADSPESSHVAHSFERAIKVSPYVLDALLIGSGRTFCTTLVAVDETTVGKYARDNDIPYTDHASLVSHPRVVALMAEQIAAVNEQLPEQTRVKAFRILMHSLDSRSEELTPALRLKRYVVERKYADLVDEMYVE